MPTAIAERITNERATDAGGATKPVQEPAEKLQGSGSVFDRQRKDALMRFADLIESSSVDRQDGATFAKVVQHAVGYGLPMNELADAFGVDKGTVSRWRAGKNAPQPFARPIVLDWIRDWARAQAERL